MIFFNIKFEIYLTKICHLYLKKKHICEDFMNSLKLQSAKFVIIILMLLKV